MDEDIPLPTKLYRAIEEARKNHKNVIEYSRWLYGRLRGIIVEIALTTMYLASKSLKDEVSAGRAYAAIKECTNNIMEIVQDEAFISFAIDKVMELYPQYFKELEELEKSKK